MDIPSSTAEELPLTASKDMPIINAPYPFQQGIAEVAKDRAKKPIKLYYELHGAGMKRIVLIAGTSFAPTTVPLVAYRSNFLVKLSNTELVKLSPL